MTYTFKLHPGVKFHDGTALTSADVKATYDRLRNPPQGVVSTRKATFGDIGTIETPDANTVIFKMKAVNAVDDRALRLAVELHLLRPRTSPPIRTRPRPRSTAPGPFTFVEHVKGSHVAGKRNDNYFKKGLPYLDGFKGVFMLQAAAMLNARAGRAGAGRVPRHLAGRARPAGARRWATRSASRSRAGRSTCWSPSTPRRSRSTTCACARRCCMAIDRWGGSAGALEDLDCCARSAA